MRFREAEALFALRGIGIAPMPTDAAGHATHLARQLSDAGHPLLYVMGGDGTLSEACEGVLTASNQPLLGFIPSGTGNDFLRGFGFHDRAHAIDRISMGRPRAIDAAVVHFDHDGQRHTRHWINVLGTGFAAQAADVTNRKLKWAGHNAYNLGVLLKLVGLRGHPTRIALDGHEREGDFPLVMVCNSVHTGGAMQMAPMARPDDGLLDVLTVEGVNRRELVGLLMKVRDGAHVRHKKVRFDRVKKVRIEPATPSPVLVDGEVLGGTPIDVEVMPGALQILL